VGGGWWTWVCRHQTELDAQLALADQYNNNNIAFFSQASWGRLEMKPERNKFKVQAH